LCAYNEVGGPEVCGGMSGDAPCVGMQAYEVLGDEKRRRIYDAQLEQALQDEDDDFTGALCLQDDRSNLSCCCWSSHASRSGCPSGNCRKCYP
jgi:hypothetical protein